MKEMNGMLRVSPVWGIGIFVGLLALIGIAPFALFMSEFYILKAAISFLQWLCICSGCIPIGSRGCLYRCARACYSACMGTPHELFRAVRATYVEYVLVIFPLAVGLGLWMPGLSIPALNAAADINPTTGAINYVSAGVSQ